MSEGKVEVSHRVEEGETAVWVDRVFCRRRRRRLSAPLPRARCCSLPSVFPFATAGLLFRLKQKAYNECRPVADAYAACMSGRTLSAAWACRPEMFALSDCLSKQ